MANVVRPYFFQSPTSYCTKIYCKICGIYLKCRLGNEAKMKIHSIKSNCRPVFTWKIFPGKRCGYLPGEENVSCYIEPLTKKLGEGKINRWVLKVPEMHTALSNYPLKFGYQSSAKKYAELREQARCALRERLSQGERFEFQIEKIPENFFFDHNGNGIVVRKIEYNMPIINPFCVNSTKTVPVGMTEIAFCNTIESAQSIVYKWERAKRAGICENLPLVSIHAPHS